MKVKLISGKDISAAQATVWTELQLSDPNLASPYYAPEFTKLVATVRNDVEVAVVKDREETVAFFPFQRIQKSVGIPVGGILSDYHGIICRHGLHCEPMELLRQCQLVAWNFDHLPVAQQYFVPFHDGLEPSPQMDLSRGFEAYVADRRSAGSEQIKKCGNLMRRIEREIGPLHFIPHTFEPALLAQVLAWKSQQYREAGKCDLFSVGWTRGVVELLHTTQSIGFSGMLSVLFAGDHLVAGHLGMRSRTIWHYWFPSYDINFSKYSPGLILLLKMAQQAPELGLGIIDLGKGMSLYKERLMNASVPLASGSVRLPSFYSIQEAMRKKWIKWLRGTRIAKLARVMLNRAKRKR